MRYQNLDLQIERDGSGTYLVQGKSSQGDFRDQTTSDLAAIVIDRESITSGRIDGAALQALGSQLFDFLFRTRTEGKLGALLDRSLGAVTQAEQGLRIRLMLDEANADVAAIPWEYLYRTLDQGYLSCRVQTPLVRFLEVGVPLRRTEATLPLSMLVVIPAVDDLNVDLEVSLLEEALGPMASTVRLTVLKGIVTPGRLHEELSRAEYDVLHFVGHGDFDGERATLRMNDESGRALAVDHEAMGALVRNEDTLKLVVLNSCQGAQLSATRAFVGMAPRLVAAGVPAVVAMQFPIKEKEALAFVKAFYGALFGGDGRGSIDFAISTARNALAIQFPGGRAFGIPAVFMRYDEGILFTVVSGGPLQGLLMSRAEAVKQQAAIENLEQSERKLAAIGESADPEVQARRQARQDELARGRRRLRFRALRVVSAAGVALVAGLAFAIGLLDRLPFTWFVAASPIWFGDPVGRSLQVDSIALVTIDQPIDSTWRPRHAAVVDKLARAGASVVVLDIAFERPHPSADSALVSAFERADARGTAVVFGAAGLDGARPRAVPALAAAATVGGVCLGENKGRFSAIVPVVWIGPPGVDGGSGVTVPSLALAAASAWRRGTAVVDLDRADVSLVDGNRRVVDRIEPNRVVEVSRTGSGGCPMEIAGSRYAELLGARAPVEVWRNPARHRDYAAVEAAEPEQLGWAKGRIVLIGSYTDADLFRRRTGLDTDERYGVERHADAIATILSDAEVKPLAGWLAFAIIGLGTAIGVWLGSRAHPGRFGAWPWLLGTVLVLAGLATAGYRYGRTLIDIIYPTVALALAFAVVTRLRRRWLG